MKQLNSNYIAAEEQQQTTSCNLFLGEKAPMFRNVTIVSRCCFLAMPPTGYTSLVGLKSVSSMLGKLLSAESTNILYTLPVLFCSRGFEQVCPYIYTPYMENKIKVSSNATHNV